ncbi:hypothetical protein ABW19_dt0205111 [Dactylella cylindrospora]|nr:hypothetical protein ABW19_dt0205111 [Dactylella cylindrospora]
MALLKVEKDMATALCQCQSQDDLNQWYREYLNTDDSESPLLYKVLRHYLLHSVSGGYQEMEFIDSRQRSRKERQRRRECMPHAEQFYKRNENDNIRRLWVYAQEQFDMRGKQFIELLGGVLVVRNFLDGIFESGHENPPPTGPTKPL